MKNDLSREQNPFEPEKPADAGAPAEEPVAPEPMAAAEPGEETPATQTVAEQAPERQQAPEEASFEAEAGQTSPAEPIPSTGLPTGSAPESAPPERKTGKSRRAGKVNYHVRRARTSRSRKILIANLSLNLAKEKAKRKTEKGGTGRPVDEKTAPQEKSARRKGRKEKKPAWKKWLMWLSLSLVLVVCGLAGFGYWAYSNIRGNISANVADILLPSGKSSREEAAVGNVGAFLSILESEPVITVKLKVRNDSAFSLPVDRAEYSVTINGRLAGTGVWSAGSRRTLLMSGQETFLLAPLKIKSTALTSIPLEVLVTRRVVIQVQGTIEADTLLGAISTNYAGKKEYRF